MRERLFALGLCWFMGLGSSVSAHEEGTAPPTPEGASSPAVAQPATATPRPAPAVPVGKAKPPSSRPLRLTLDEKDRWPATPPAATAKPDAGVHPGAPAATVTSPAGRADAPTKAESVAAKKSPALKLAPSAKEIEGERKTVLKPKVEPRPDQYENQRPDVPAPTQVRRVPGPGSGVGSTAADRKATMIENSGPQQNSTYRRW